MGAREYEDLWFGPKLVMDAVGPGSRGVSFKEGDSVSVDSEQSYVDFFSSISGGTKTTRQTIRTGHLTHSSNKVHKANLI